MNELEIIVLFKIFWLVICIVVTVIYSIKIYDWWVNFIPNNIRGIHEKEFN